MYRRRIALAAAAAALALPLPLPALASAQSSASPGPGPGPGSGPAGTSNNDTDGLGSQPGARHVISEAQALNVAHAASAASARMSVPVSIAVTDPAGLLVAFLLTDNAVRASVDASLRQARAVAAFNGLYTTQQLQALTGPGQMYAGYYYHYGGLDSSSSSCSSGGGASAAPGGVPVALDGFFLGAVGVAGGSPSQNIAIASYAAGAINGTCRISCDSQ